jgi:hypothetical protein
MKMRLKSNMVFEFETGVTIKVNLDNVDADEYQSKIIGKLIQEVGEINLVENREFEKFDSERCDDGLCPAQRFLSEEEFEAVRHLKVRLGTDPGLVAAGVIVNFCLDVLIV